MDRQQLQEEYKRLRNMKLSKPKEYEGTRVRNIYYDHLNESDKLAEIKSDEDLLAAIQQMRELK